MKRNREEESLPPRKKLSSDDKDMIAMHAIIFEDLDITSRSFFLTANLKACFERNNAVSGLKYWYSIASLHKK